MKAQKPEDILDSELWTGSIARLRERLVRTLLHVDPFAEVQALQRAQAMVQALDLVEREIRAEITESVNLRNSTQ